MSVHDEDLFGAGGRRSLHLFGSVRHDVRPPSSTDSPHPKRPVRAAMSVLWSLGAFQGRTREKDAFVCSRTHPNADDAGRRFVDVADDRSLIRPRYGSQAHA